MSRWTQLCSKSSLRVLFIHNGRERFVLDDLSLLRRSFDVTDWYQPTRHYNPARLLHLVRSHDLIFCWFASWHALAPVYLARRLGKPAIVIVGGYDTACVPQAGYGAQRGGLPRLVARFVIRQATHLVTNSYAARNEAIVNAGADGDKISVIYHGVEPFPMDPADPREPVALTVGGVWRGNLLRKGLLPFVQAATFLPDVRFILAGRWFDDGIEVLRKASGSNVELRGFISDEELVRLYGSASVYVQASLHEGFGLSVAEAMSAGCIPVVTRAGSLPEVVGDTGIFVESNDPQHIAQGIHHGLNSTGDQRDRARARVVNSFSMAERVRELTAVVTTAMKSDRCIAAPPRL